MKVRAAAAPRAADLQLALDNNVVTGKRGFREAFGAPTTLEEDLLNVLAAIYCTDLAVKRGQRERVLRSIDLTVEVSNHQAFEAVREDLEYALYLLSHDNWSLHFDRGHGQPEAQREWLSKKGVTLLFSGGLDSYCGAADFLGRRRAIHLVSHTTHNVVVATAQRDLHEHLENHFGTSLPRFAAQVYGRTRPAYPFPRDTEREETQRTRSLLFLGLACLAARRTGFGEIIAIAENGQMALHLPLTTARIGPFSTHTAHPEFVNLAQDIFTRLLSYPFTFTNPFLYLTKAEVIARLPPELVGTIHTSVSCWRASRVSQGYRHCGECVPCLVRRFALEARGVRLPEYARDLFQEDVGALPDTDTGKGNIVDVLELVRRFSPPHSANASTVTEHYPDLINDHIDLGQALAMYGRFAAEVQAILPQYPSVQALLP